MKIKTVPRWALIALALLAVGALLTGMVSAQAPAGSPAAHHAGERVLSGGQYMLVLPTPEAGVRASGYQLLQAPQEQGSGCCCKNYVPCVSK